MASNSFSVENPDALADLLNSVEQATGESVLRKAAAAAVTVYKNEVVHNAPQRDGDLAKGVSVAYVPEESVTGTVATYVVAFIGKARDLPNGKPGMRLADVARWLEYGHYDRTRSRWVPAYPFIRPAFDAKQQEAADAAEKQILEALERGG